MCESNPIGQEVLLAQLQERYNAMHQMRDRSMQFVLWVLGLGIGVAWLAIKEATLTSPQKWAISILLAIVCAVAVFFVCAIDRGFQNNRKTLIRIEKSLGLYDPQRVNTSEAILPNEFSSTKKRWNSHFNTLYVLLFTFYFLLIVLTWVNPNPNPNPNDKASIKPIADANQFQTFLSNEVK